MIWFAGTRLKGDAPPIGEIVAAAQRLLEALDEFAFEERLMGGCSIDEHGIALTDEVLAACRASDAVLLGAVGGPKWDTTDPEAPRPEQGLLGLRKGLGLFANLRPVRPSAALLDASPLKRERIEGTDLLVVRELTGWTVIRITWSDLSRPIELARRIRRAFALALTA